MIVTATGRLLWPWLLLAIGGPARADAVLEPPEWSFTDAQRVSLQRREVWIDARPADAASPTTRFVRAAVRIDAPPARVFALMIDCAQALQFVPHLRRCERLARAADGSWDDIEHEVDYGWYLPGIHYTFRATYVPDRRVDFMALSGDLAINEGSWMLEPLDDGLATLVRYRVRLQPRMYVPKWLVRSSLERELPELLVALRTRSESDAVEIPARFAAP